ncbi:hypothetical protein [Asticcacaulis excentricus]|nr:hypothetical protein [Asticcacaulis excentricus]
MKWLIGFILLSGLAGSPAFALQVEGPLSPVVTADVKQHPDFLLRKQHPNAYLSDKGDFDGDGQADEVAFHKNAKGQVVVLIKFGNGLIAGLPTQLLSLKDDMPRAGVKTVKPGTYKMACAKKAGPDNQSCQPEVTTKTDAFEVFTFEAGSVLYIWKEEEFRPYVLTD